MFHFTTLMSSCAVAVSLLAGQALAAQPQMPVQAPAQRAFAQPAAPGAVCMNNGRLVSHVAYLPVDPAQTMPCGHLLSTDTVLTVHHWDKT